MKPTRLFTLAAALALFAGAALAQNTAPADKPADRAAAKMRECDKPRHDHGAEKGTPTPKSARCAAEENKGKTTQKAHDHNKVHK
jgi:hypothetical protein